MRNLKKVLSLALALVMLLGMMVVGAGATSFKDDADIQNKEAVAVLVGMGIMKGREDGSNFEPAGTLTRAEAAKMIAQLDLGVDAADALVANGANTFSDVWAGHWAGGAIDYCVEQGYITGDGNGHFFPGRNVSSVEFGIMLLRLLGYDAKIEGLVGDQWASKGAALARKAGLTTGVVANTQAMSRDDMAQMAFNALTAPMVEYEGMDITIGDVAINARSKIRTHTGSSSLGVSNTTYNGESIQANITPIRLCEERFPNLKLTTDEDVFGRVESVWTWKNVNIADSAKVLAADYEYTEKKSSVSINGATGGIVVLNGRTLNTTEINSYKSSSAKNGVVDANLVAGISANGRLVQVFLKANDHKQIEKVVAIDTYVARVSAVSSANETTTVTTMGNTPGTLDSRTVKMTGFATGDIVAYTAAYGSNGKYAIEEMDVLTDPVNGTLTKWTGSSVVDTSRGTSDANFTIDNGDPYKYSVNRVIRDIDGADVQISAFNANKSELNVYLDKYNFALYVAGVEGEKNYAAVIGIGATNAYGSETKGVTLLLADGTTVEATAKLASGLAWTDFKGHDKTYDTNQGTYNDASNKNLVTDGVADVVTYTVDSKGVYTLSLVDNYEWVTGGTPAVTFVNGKSLLTVASNNYYTTSKTVFMVCTGSGTNRSYNVYTGYANAPGIAAAADVNGIAYGLNRLYNNQIDVVYIDASKMDNMTAANTYFVKSASPTVYTDSTGRYFVLPAVVEGEVTEIKIDAGLVKAWDGDNEALVLADAGLYAIDGVQKDENDIIIACTLKSASAAFRATGGQKVGTIAANGEVLGWNNGGSPNVFYAYNDKTHVFYVDKDYKEISPMAVNDVQTDNNDLIYADHDGGSGEKKLSNVFVVEQDPAATYTLSWTAPTENVSNFAVKVGASAITSGTELTATTTVTVEANVASNYKLKFTVGGTEKTITGNSSTTFSMPAANTTLTFEVEDTTTQGYPGTVVFDTTTPGTTTATWTDADRAPSSDELASLLIDELVRKGYPKDKMTDLVASSSKVEVKAKQVVNGVEKAQETFTITLPSGLVKIQTISNADDLATAITGGSTTKVILKVDATVTAAPTMDIDVASDKTLTLNVSGGATLGKDITGAGKVAFADNLTGGIEHVKVTGGISVATDKTLPVDAAWAVPSDITGAGNVTATAAVTNGDKIKITGKLTMGTYSSIDKIGNVDVEVTGATEIKGVAAPKSLTHTGGKITVTATTGDLTLPAAITIHADGMQINGKVTAKGDVTISATAVAIGANGTLDLGTKNLIGSSGAKLGVTAGAKVINVGSTTKFFDASGTAISGNVTAAGSTATYDWGNNYGTGTNETGWKADA